MPPPDTQSQLERTQDALQDIQEYRAMVERVSALEERTAWTSPSARDTGYKTAAALRGYSTIISSYQALHGDSLSALQDKNIEKVIRAQRTMEADFRELYEDGKPTQAKIREHAEQFAERLKQNGEIIFNSGADDHFTITKITKTQDGYTATIYDAGNRAAENPRVGEKNGKEIVAAIKERAFKPGANMADFIEASTVKMVSTYGTETYDRALRQINGALESKPVRQVLEPEQGKGNCSTRGQRLLTADLLRDPQLSSDVYEFARSANVPEIAGQLAGKVEILESRLAQETTPLARAKSAFGRGMDRLQGMFTSAAASEKPVEAPEPVRAGTRHPQAAASLEETLERKGRAGDIDYPRVGDGTKNVALIKGEPEELRALQAQLGGRGIETKLEDGKSEFGKGLRVRADSMPDFMDMTKGPAAAQEKRPVSIEEAIERKIQAGKEGIERFRVGDDGKRSIALIKGEPEELRALQAQLAGRGIETKLEDGKGEFPKGLRIRTESMPEFDAMIKKDYRRVDRGSASATDVKYAETPVARETAAANDDHAVRNVVRPDFSQSRSAQPFQQPLAGTAQSDVRQLPVTPRYGTQASADSPAAAGADAANDSSLKMGQTNTVDQGNLAVKPAPQNQPAATPQLQSGQTSNVGQNGAPAANNAAPPAPLQQGQTSNIGQSQQPAANDAHKVAPAEPTPSQTSIKAGAKAAIKGSALISGGIAVVSGAVETTKALYHGDSVADAAAKGGGAFVDGLPVIGAIKAGRGAEAAMQGVSTVLIGAALAAAPLSGGTSFLAATAIEETLRRGGKALGLDLDDAMTTNMAKAMAGAIEKTIPMSAMQTNMRFLSAQEGMLKDAGLGEKDKNGKTAADYLRDPATRDAYVTSLKGSLAKATDPAAREQMGRMVEAADKFVEMEGRRVAKLAPYMKEVEGKLAATLKVQQLASKFKDETPTQETVIASSSTAHNPTAPAVVAIQSPAAVNPQSRH